jgi:hypothetical protein
MPRTGEWSPNDDQTPGLAKLKFEAWAELTCARPYYNLDELGGRRRP